MSTELVAVALMALAIVLGVFMKDGGLRDTFYNSAPKLGARVEKELETGHGFHDRAREMGDATWSKPKK